MNERVLVLLISDRLCTTRLLHCCKTVKGFPLLNAAAGWSLVWSTLPLLQRHSCNLCILIFFSSPPSHGMMSLATFLRGHWYIALFLSYIFLTPFLPVISGTEFPSLVFPHILYLLVFSSPHPFFSCFRGDIISSSSLVPLLSALLHQLSSRERMQRTKARLPPSEKPTGQLLFIKTRTVIVHHRFFRLQNTVSIQSKGPLFPSMSSCV